MRNLYKFFPALAVGLLALTSCTAMQTSEQSAESTASSESPPLIFPELGETQPVADESTPLPAEQAPQDLPANVDSEPTIYRGTDEVFRQPPAQPPVRLLGDAVSLNFEEAPLTEVVHAIMGDILELDYVVEHPINGQVTLRTRSPVPRDQLLDILESLLTANQAYLVRDANGRFFVSGSPEMRKLRPGLSSSASAAVGYSTIVVPLQFISAKNMAEILAPVANDDAFVRIDNLRNVLMLAGTRSQLEGWQEIITTFDVDLLEGMSVGIYPIENSSIDEVEAALGELMGKGGGDGGAEGLAGIGSMVRIIPVARLNSLLVVTPRAHYLSRIGTWIERLDQEPDAYFERRLYVYPVQNTNALHLADMLSTIFSGSGGSGGGGSRNAGVAPGFTPETVSSGGESSIGDASGASGGRGDVSRNFSLGDVRVVADEENNGLLIYATGKEYRKIKPALERLDIAATQVIIEASIIEVTLNDNLRYGLEWTFDGGVGSGNRGVAQLFNDDSLAPQTPGFAYSIINGGGQIKAVLNALASDNLLNVISSPSVMVLDNQTANIQVGDQVPVRAGTTQSGEFVTQNIEYRDTGVQLSVTPSVNAGGMVVMDIEQSVTDVGPLGEGVAESTFLERSITSRVAVRSSESVVLGGLIRENKSQGSSGVPFLHELPVIGALFGTKSTTSTRTELIVIITPRVIFDDADLRDVSRDMRRQMRGLELIDVSDSSSFLIEREPSNEK